jgi:hypothetical protein
MAGMAGCLGLLAGTISWLSGRLACPALWSEWLAGLAVWARCLDGWLGSSF